MILYSLKIINGDGRLGIFCEWYVGSFSSAGYAGTIMVLFRFFQKSLGWWAVCGLETSCLSFSKEILWSLQKIPLRFLLCSVKFVHLFFPIFQGLKEFFFAFLLSVLLNVSFLTKFLSKYCSNFFPFSWRNLWFHSSLI